MLDEIERDFEGNLMIKCNTTKHGEHHFKNVSIYVYLQLLHVILNN